MCSSDLHIFKRDNDNLEILKGGEQDGKDNGNVFRRKWGFSTCERGDIWQPSSDI